MSEPTTTTAKAPAKPAKVQSAFWEFVQTIVVAVLIAVAFRTVAYEPFNIPSGSMYPTLRVGDYLLVSKFSYGYSKHSFPWSLGPFEGRILAGDVERGDVIVFKWPGDDRTDYIKRVVGLPGDTIETRGGALYVNGQPVGREQIEDYVMEDGDGKGGVYRQIRETMPNGVSYNTLDCEYEPGTRECQYSPGDDRGPYKVTEGHYFMMGDNRDRSADSRFDLFERGVGLVPAENLVGRAEVLFFSTCGSDCDAPLWKPWNWFGAMRYSRFFTGIE